MEIKQRPEDFVVEELIELDKIPGKYLYLKVKKRNLNTLDVVKIFCSKLKIPRKDISYAGAKDKVAVTTQYFSVFRGNPEECKKINNGNLEVTPLHFGSRPISLGALEGNRFRIKVYLPLQNLNFTVNYFGEQRFSENNLVIGKAILQKDFKKACSLIKEFQVKSHLEKSKNDYIGALQKLDKKLLSLFVHAYQSYVWNELVKAYLKEKYKDAYEFGNLVFVKEKKEALQIPLIAFDTIFMNKDVERIANEILKKEGISLRDFVLRSFPEAMPISLLRDVFIEVKDVKREKGCIEFTLPKGAYATVFLKHLESFL